MTAEKSIVLSVIVPVLNEERYIESTLRQLAEQTLAKQEYEIIVVDGGSNDLTQKIIAETASRYPEVSIRTLHNPARLSSAGRNMAIAQGRGEYFLLVDGHVQIPNRDLLKDAITCARARKAMCLGRPQPLNPFDVSPFQRAVALARSSMLAHSRESFVYSDYEGWVSPISVAVMYHRDLFKIAGAFDERFDAAEDLEFNYRLEKAGVKCYISPKFSVYYYPRNSYRSLFRQMERYGMGRAAFVRKHPERFTIETIVPSLFVLTIGAGVLAATASTLFRLLLMLVAGIYGVALIAEGIRIYYKTRDVVACRIPLIIAVVHVGLGVGFIRGFFRRNCNTRIAENGIRNERT